MIPIRNFPYTDYHDLNLDFLLRQFQIFEADLEELKRRVKALEDWRIDVVEPDILTIKADIRDIKGDIITIKGDIVDIKGDIVDIKGDITTIINNTKNLYFVVTENPDTLEIHSNAVDGPVLDYTDPDVYAAIVNWVNNINEPSKGSYSLNCFILFQNAYYECNIDVFEHRILVQDSMLNLTRKTIFARYLSINDDGTYSFNFGSINALSSLISETIYPNELVASGDADYPYKYVIHNDNIFASSDVFVYFERFADFKTYSPIMCEYVHTGTQIAEIFFTEVPANSFNINYRFTGGN